MSTKERAEERLLELSKIEKGWYWTEVTFQPYGGTISPETIETAAKIMMCLRILGVNDIRIYPIPDEPFSWINLEGENAAGDDYEIQVRDDKVHQVLLWHEHEYEDGIDAPFVFNGAMSPEDKEHEKKFITKLVNFLFKK